MSKESRQRSIIAYAVVALALLGLFLVPGISRVHAQETAETISTKVEKETAETTLEVPETPVETPVVTEVEPAVEQKPEEEKPVEIVPVVPVVAPVAEVVAPAPVVVTAVTATIPAGLAISDELGGTSQSQPSVNLGTLAISDEFGGASSATPATGENTFTTGGPTGGTNQEQNFTTLPLGENTFTTLANPTTGCTSNCGGGGGGGGGGGSSSGGQVLGVSTVPPAPCPLYLHEYIRLGRANNPVEVRKLQAFLNVFEGERLAITGVYTQADFDAVSRFQAKYLSDVLQPWGIDGSTGYVFVTTTFAINNIYCGRSTANDLDLRNFYPEVAATIASRATSPSENLAGALASTTASSAIAAVPQNFFQTAALSLSKFFNFGPATTIISLLILAIISMFLLIWHLSKYPDTREPVMETLEADQYLAIDHGENEEGVIIADDNVSLLDISDDDPTQPTLDKLG